MEWYSSIRPCSGHDERRKLFSFFSLTISSPSFLPLNILTLTSLYARMKFNQTALARLNRIVISSTFNNNTNSTINAMLNRFLEQISNDFSSCKKIIHRHRTFVIILSYTIHFFFSRTKKKIQILKKKKNHTNRD